MNRHPRRIQPAPPRPIIEWTRKTCFYDLPAELRIEIYKLVLEDVTIHILPLNADTRNHCQHALALTSRQVRHEVIPVIHSTCAIRADVTDFNFSGMLQWMNRIPAPDQKYLLQNERLSINLCTTKDPPTDPSLRKWLKARADPYRPQPRWVYSGPRPTSKVANDLKRRAKRMHAEHGKQTELKTMLEAVDVSVDV